MPPRPSKPPAERDACPPDTEIDPPRMLALVPPATSVNFPALPAPPKLSSSTSSPKHPLPLVMAVPLPAPRASGIISVFSETSPPLPNRLIPGVITQPSGLSAELPVRIQSDPATPDATRPLTTYRSPVIPSSIADLLKSLISPESVPKLSPLRTKTAPAALSPIPAASVTLPPRKSLPVLPASTSTRPPSAPNLPSPPLNQSEPPTSPAPAQPLISPAAPSAFSVSRSTTPDAAPQLPVEITIACAISIVMSPPDDDSLLPPFRITLPPPCEVPQPVDTTKFPPPFPPEPAWRHTVPPIPPSAVDLPPRRWVLPPKQAPRPASCTSAPPAPYIPLDPDSNVEVPPAPTRSCELPAFRAISPPVLSQDEPTWTEA